MKDIIIILILAAIAASAGYYIYSQKKKGSKCIGCPYGSQCGRKCSDNKK